MTRGFFLTCRVRVLVHVNPGFGLGFHFAGRTVFVMLGPVTVEAWAVRR